MIEVSTIRRYVSCTKGGGGGGSICNENPFITPSISALGFLCKCQTKDQNVAVIMVYETLFYLSKFNKFHTFKKHTNIHCIYFPPNCKDAFFA